MIRSITFLCCLLLTIANVNAQYELTGRVLDTYSEGLMGAAVLEKGTSNGIVTDVDGKFKITLRDSIATLVITYTGFDTKELKLDGKTRHQKIIMDEGVSLDEVVVSGMEMRREKRARSTISSSPKPTRSRVAEYRRESAAPKTYALETVRSVAPSAMASEESTVDSKVESGLLTAGEVNDFQKWDLWEDVAKEDLERWQKHWQIRPLERYAVQLITEDNTAVIDAKVSLLENGKSVWEARSDNTGKAELWANLFQVGDKQSNYSVVVEYEGKEHNIKSVHLFQQGVNQLTLPIACKPANQQVDIAFVVDATGSMGDEIEYLKVELNDIIQKVKTEQPELVIRLGTVFYRDEGENEEYLTRKSPFSKEINQTTDFIKKQYAAGGGDNPEAVEHALLAAIDSMAWSENALARFMFIVLDAPPHHDPKIVKQLQTLGQKAAAKGIRIIPLAASGIDKSTEYLMRSFALMTNGTYAFLTDHSGIGDTHIEPSTDSYDVETLNDLLIRLIQQYTYVPSCENTDLQALEIPKKKAEFPKTDTSKALSWTCAPNPTSGPLQIAAKGELDYLYLTDRSGKILQRYELDKTKRLNLDIGKYPSGLYFLMAKSGEKALKSKVILAH